MTAKPELRLAEDAPALARMVAGWLLEHAHAAHDRFSLCLSGGETPLALYRELAEPPFRDVFPWTKTHLFWGDERFVPPDDPRSNYGQARAALLRHVPCPTANIHPIPTEAPADNAEAARLYERTLNAFYSAYTLSHDRPLFDVVLLGLGGDGHTASLFPGSPVLDERTRWVAPAEHEDVPRITLTYPALESSRATAFLVSGAGKRNILKRVLDGDRTLPAARLVPHGDFLIFADRAAAPD